MKTRLAVLLCLGTVVFIVLAMQMKALAPTITKIRARAIRHSCNIQSLRNSMQLSRLPWSGLEALVEPAVTTINCDIAIVCAGFRRSGSTLQQKLVLLALDHLNITRVTLYWNYHLHLLQRRLDFPNLAGAYGSHEEFISKLGHFRKYQDRLINGVGGNTAVVIKSHQFDDRIMGMCKRQVVFAIRRRNEANAVKSILATGDAESAGELPLDRWRRDYECWIQAGATEVLYEDVEDHPEWHVLQLSAAIASRLDIPWQEDVSNTMTNNASQFKSVDANPGIPGHKFSGRSTRNPLSD